MNNRILLSVVVCLLTVLSAAGQQLTLSVQMDRTPSPYLADWKMHPNTVRLLVTNATGQSQDVRVEAYVEGDRRGRVAETKRGASVPQVAIPPGTTILTAADAHVLDEGAVRYIGSAANDAVRTGRLPDDQYRLCVRLVKYASPEA